MKFLAFVLSLSFAACGVQTKDSESEVKEQIVDKKNPTKLMGYVNVDRRNRPYYVSVGIDKLELTSVLPINTFNKTQIKNMYTCMGKRETHAISVTSYPAIQTGIPTGIPGRTTTTHFPVFTNVRCVKADGFLRIWRAIVRNSHFG